MSALHVIDTATLKVDTGAPRLPIGVLGEVVWHRNNHDLAFSLTTVRQPSDVYSLDADTSKLERWTNSETAVNMSSFADAELIRWEEFRRQDHFRLSIRPPAKFTGKHPVLIEIHGGPGRPITP